MTDEPRNLTNADVIAILDGMEERIEARFYERLGHGVWGMVWKVIVAGLLFIVGWEVHRNGGLS